jgi:predicted small secreted protein
MKKSCFLLTIVLLALTLVCGCNTENAALDDTALDDAALNDTAPNAELVNLDVALLMAGLDQVMLENGLPAWFNYYTDELIFNNNPNLYNFHCYEFETITLYHGTSEMGINAIVYYDKLRDEWNVIDLGMYKYAYYTVKIIGMDNKNPERIELLCESSYSDGAYIFKNFNSLISYSLTEKKIDEVVYRLGDGNFGMTSFTDEHYFEDYYLEDNSAVFHFYMSPGGVSYGLPGPEIIINDVLYVKKKGDAESYENADKCSSSFEAARLYAVGRNNACSDHDLNCIGYYCTQL